jgi:hypothetical protein
MPVAGVMDCVAGVDEPALGTLYLSFLAAAHLSRCLRGPLLVSYTRGHGHGHLKQRRM